MSLKDNSESGKFALLLLESNENCDWSKDKKINFYLLVVLMVRFWSF